MTVTPSLKMVSFMLWQRMANEEKEGALKEQIETTTSELQEVKETSERELVQKQRIHDCSRAMTSLSMVMEGARRRALTQMINRWNCVAVTETTTARITEEKEKERETAVNALEAAKTAELTAVKEDHARAVATMTAEHEAKVEKIITEHEAKVETLTIDHKTAVEKMTTEHEAKVNEMENARCQEKEAHMNEVKQLKECHQLCMYC